MSSAAKRACGLVFHPNKPPFYIPIRARVDNAVELIDGSRGMLSMGRSEARDLRPSTADGYRCWHAWLWHIGLGFLIGSAGSSSFVALKLPLPWFLGSLTFCLFAVGRMLGSSVHTRLLFLCGPSSASPSARRSRLPAVADRWHAGKLSLALLVPWMLVIIGLGVPFFERVARFDRATAFFSAIPGGLTDIVTLAPDSGANTRTVMLAQASRIVLIVFALPLWLQWHAGYLIGG
jgi:uncharacterized membrane protein AbrB (regulator of aidB expression)